jgi:hypothetical protein
MDLVAGAKILHERLAGLVPPVPPEAPQEAATEPVQQAPAGIVGRVAAWSGFLRRR